MKNRILQIILNLFYKDYGIILVKEEPKAGDTISIGKMVAMFVENPNLVKNKFFYKYE